MRLDGKGYYLLRGVRKITRREVKKTDLTRPAKRQRKRKKKNDVGDNGPPRVVETKQARQGATEKGKSDGEGLGHHEKINRHWRR